MCNNRIIEGPSMYISFGTCYVLLAAPEYAYSAHKLAAQAWLCSQKAWRPYKLLAHACNAVTPA